MLSWQGAVGRPFRVAGTIGSMSATLTSVGALPTEGVRPAQVRRQPFALTFTLDPGQRAASDQIYFVETGLLAPMNLFPQAAVPGILTALLN